MLDYGPNEGTGVHDTGKKGEPVMHEADELKQGA